MPVLPPACPVHVWSLAPGGVAEALHGAGDAGSGRAGDHAGPETCQLHHLPATSHTGKHAPAG